MVSNISVAGITNSLQISCFLSSLNLALRTFIRDKRSYTDMRNNLAYGRLPHPSLLKRYKNKIPQESGINHSLLKWMDDEASRLDTSKSGRTGGLIFDETSLQVKLEL